MILVPATVETDFLHTGGQSTLGDSLTDNRGGGDISAVEVLGSERFIHGRGRRERLVFVVVYDLRVDVFRAAEDGKTRSIGMTLHRVGDPEFADLSLNIQSLLLSHGFTT